MKVSVIGYGGRGRLYSEILLNKGIKIEALCDVDKEKLSLGKEELKLEDSQLFDSEEKFFAHKKMSDILFVCTQDELHYRHAIKGLEKGYDLLLEKPIATSVEQCNDILNTAKKLNRNVFVCHVLRYAPFFTQIKRELDTGDYGKVVTVSITENVGYWHQAHSYVRGNWRNDKTATPMIIAKSCHDLDLISWFVDSDYKSVSSFGSLDYFKSENAPENCADRCLDCQYVDTCVYSAKKIYIKDRAEKGKLTWPCDILVSKPTVEKLYEVLETSPYGKCVYKCDNNVVDHQVVNIVFKNNATAQLTMTAFSDEVYREIHVHGEKGEIYGNMMDNLLHCNIFGKSKKVIDTNIDSDTSYGHGGGDVGMLNEIINFYEGKPTHNLTSIDRSMQSHYIGFMAEESRVKNGNLK